MEKTYAPLITGGTGFIGQHLAHKIKNPVILGRNIKKINRLFPGLEAREWDPAKTLNPSLIEEVEVVFHLAGESVFRGRWNKKKKERIRQSRIEGTKRLVDAITQAKRKPKALISSSAIGYFGSRGDELLTETSSPGDDFLAQVCLDWEKEALRAEERGVRVVVVRTGIVLGRSGGALAEMLPPFQLGLGGKLGSGHQYISWIHIDDLTNIMLYAARNSNLHGPINAVSPNPVRNIEFTESLAQTLNKPALLPMPKLLLRAIVGEFANSLLSSQRTSPASLQKAGFIFSFPKLQPALADLLPGRS